MLFGGAVLDLSTFTDPSVTTGTPSLLLYHRLQHLYVYVRACVGPRADALPISGSCLRRENNRTVQPSASLTDAKKVV